VISPSASTVGGSDIVIIPSVDPYNFSVNLDNYGSRFLGPLQASFAGQFNNTFGAGETIQLQYVTDPDDDERAYGYARYEMPINNIGTKFGFDYSHSDTTPGFNLDAFDVNGRSDLYGIDLSHPVIRSRTQNLNASLRFDYRNLRSKNIVDTFTTQDRIAAVRGGLDYSVFDNLWKPAVNQARLTLSQGVKLFNVTESGDANTTRANGDPQFTKIEAEFSRLQTLNPEFSLLTSVIGQLSNNPLLSSEEVGFGGRGYGRGYDSSEIIGDDGFGASVELRWNPNHEVSYIKDYEVFGFYDFGKIWNQETDVDSLETQSIASAGFGVRTDFTDAIKGEFIYAQPLTKNVDVYENTHGRFKFSLGASF
jgi:hemolysin activation/secretion protein